MNLGNIHFRSLFLLLVCFFLYGISFSQLTILNDQVFQTEDEKIAFPHFSYDGKHLVFIKENDSGREMVECMKNSEGSWSEPVVIDVLTAYDTTGFRFESPCYNHDASEIYFSMSHKNSLSGKDIYVIKKEKGIWAKPKKLSLKINTNKDETDPFISADGKHFFLARSFENKELKKFDCYRMYVSEFEKGEWQTPILLPEPVNDGCDRCPRLAPDGKTLYFASVRNDGDTDYDLYYAKKITKNAWMSPVLIDTINNTEIESFPSPMHKGERLYFMKSTGTGRRDKTMLAYTELTVQFQAEKSLRLYGIVKDLRTGNPLHANIRVVDPNTSMILSDSETDEITGTYSVYLPKDRKYRIDVSKDGYSHNFYTHNTLHLFDFKELKKDFELYSEVSLILNVYDSEIFEPLEAEVSVYDNRSDDRLPVSETTLEKGMYKLTLPIGKIYIIKAANKHFETDSFKLDLSGVVQFSEFERDIELDVRKIDYVFNITDEETGEGVEALVEIINLTTNEKIVKKVKTDKDGKLKIKLRDGTRYEINITPQGYAYYNTTVDLVEEDSEYVTDAKLTPLKKQTKLELNNIYFETNSADLSKESFKELNRVVTLLKNNPQIKIEISAHTDDTGTEAYNLKLSDKRANSVKEYLFGKDISEEQIISKGYGESKPAYLPFHTEENRAKNRRVELEVIDIKEE